MNQITIEAGSKEVFNVKGNIAARDWNPDGELIHINDNIIVVKFKGYTMNPGSRNSGLRTYVSTETVVYAISKRDGNRVTAFAIGAWDARKK